MGEVSAARQVLEAAELAPGNNATLELLTDRTRRPRDSIDPIPDEVQLFRPAEPFVLDVEIFLKKFERGTERGGGGTFGNNFGPFARFVGR